MNIPTKFNQITISKIERDNTDAEIVRELIEDGIKKDDIILADNAVPFQKLDELIAV